MKKKYLMIAVVMAACMVASGCGKKEETIEKTETETEVTVAPVEEKDAKATPTPALVNMQKGTKPTMAPEKKEIGTKTATASSVKILNRTSKTITQMYIRPTVEDGEWGEPLLSDSMTWKNSEFADYYFEPKAVNEEGEEVSSFDIRIVCADEDESEWYFRKLPLGTMKDLSLMINGTGEDAIPYVNYTVKSNNKQISTLEEVKERLGFAESEKDDGEYKDSESQSSSQNSESERGDEELTNEQTYIFSDDAKEAKNYIGLSVNELLDGMGDPESSGIEENEAGLSGYYYYDGYTVSTSIDENGNEVVSGVW